MTFKDTLFSKYKFNQGDWENTIRFFTPEVLAAKFFFLKENEVSNRLTVVQSGFLRTYITNEKGDEITTQFHLPGTVVLSIDSFNNQNASKENIVAVENSEILSLYYKDLQQLHKLIPAWQLICMDLAEIKNQKLNERNLEFQTLSAAERYKKLIENKPEIIQKATVGQIASYLGVDIATLSRIRKNV